MFHGPPADAGANCVLPTSEYVARQVLGTSPRMTSRVAPVASIPRTLIRMRGTIGFSCTAVRVMWCRDRAVTALDAIDPTAELRSSLRTRLIAPV
jgi:hypothetical protein